MRLTSTFSFILKLKYSTDTFHASSLERSTISKTIKGFQDNMEFYTNVKQEAYKHLEKTRSYQEFVRKGYTMSFKFRFYYEYKSKTTNKIELWLAAEPWWGAKTGNPEKPHGREGI